MDWEKAKLYLEELAQAYGDIGQAGMFGLGIIASLKNRYDKGERTQELYDEIMETK